MLLDTILAARRPGRPLVVGINGVDGSGKSTLACDTARELVSRGHHCVVIPVDGFHHPRAYRWRRGELSADGYLLDSIDFGALVADALAPLRHATELPIAVRTASLDLDTDEPVDRRVAVAADSIVIVEGVFLFQPPMLDLLDLAVFLDVDFDTILERVAARDADRFGSSAVARERYIAKYIPAQKRYLEAFRPGEIADIVIDNKNFASPAMTVTRPRRSSHVK